MKYITLCLCLFSFSSYAQTPYPTIQITAPLTSGISNLSNVDNIEVYNSNTQNAKVDLQASKEILISPNSIAANFNANGNFHASINPTSIELVSFHTNGWSNIPKYDRFEIGVKLPVNIQNQINDFLNGLPGINPYDPSQIQIECTYNYGAYKRYGFYYRDFMTLSNEWIEKTNDFTFRIRLAPSQIGSNVAEVKVIVNGIVIETMTRFFDVINNSNPGHLEVDGSNLLKLQFDNGNIFFGVGQNIPFAPGIGNTPCIDISPYSSCVCHDAYERQRNWLNDLADNGGNFTRIRIDAESNPVEWSYVPILTTDPSINPSQSKLKYLNNYDNNQRYMWELDNTVNTLENRGIYAILCLLEDQNYSVLSNYTNAPEHLWEYSPYSALLGNDLNGCKIFFSDSNAKDLYKKQLYYIMARWGYSSKIAMWEMINETINVANNTFKSNDKLIENDPTFNVNVKNWVCDMKFYLQQFYPLKPATTGFISDDNTKSLAYNCLNVWSSNSYIAHTNNTGDYFDDDFNSRANTSIGAPASSSGPAIPGYFPSYKPFFWGELGMADAINIIDQRSDRSFHNAIWASTFTGGISNGLYWNDFDQRLGVNHRQNFKALRAFTNMIDFSQRLIPEKSYDNGQAGSAYHDREIHSWWMKNSAKNYVVGWTKNNSANWTQDFQYLPNPDQSIILNNCNFNNNIDEYTCFSTNQNPETTITGLLSFTNYKIKIYNTYDNANEIDTKIKTTDAFGKLTFRRTMYSSINDPFNPDYAFIIRPNSVWRLANNNNISVNDTIYATTLDTVSIFSNLISNCTKYKFNWDGINKEYANDSIVFINYQYEGNYNINLEAKNAENDTIINHHFVIIISNKVIEKELDKIALYPIPANNNVYLYYNNEIIKNPKIMCFDMLGKEIVLPQTGLFEFDTSHLIEGMYTIKIKYSTNEKIFKISIQH